MLLGPVKEVGERRKIKYRERDAVMSVVVVKLTTQRPPYATLEGGDNLTLLVRYSHTASATRAFFFIACLFFFLVSISASRARICLITHGPLSDKIGRMGHVMQARRK